MIFQIKIKPASLKIVILYVVADSFQLAEDMVTREGYDINEIKSITKLKGKVLL